MITTNLRIPDDIHEALKTSAEKNHRSLNGEILNAIEFYLAVSKIARVDERDHAPTVNECRWCGKPEAEHKTTDRHKFKAVKNA